ncbi:MAG: permease [Halanaerobiales bacterium]|nr:permease [Halanaerobiales bacterium]
MKLKIQNILIFSLFTFFIFISTLISYNPGLAIRDNFIQFAVSMVKILPAAFILIGLFEVWVKRETVEKHFGQNSGMKGFIWAIILASTTVGGTYVAFPVAYSLFHKGARYSIIFTYIGAAALVRIPMTLFEASFLGIKFTMIRLFTSLPLIIITSIWLDKLIGPDYQLKDDEL